VKLRCDRSPDSAAWSLKVARQSHASKAKGRHHVTEDRRSSSHHQRIIEAIEKGAGEFNELGIVR